MFYSIIDCRGKVSFRVTRILLWEDWWICRHVAYVVTIPGNVSPAVSYPDLLSGCCVRSECGHNRTVFQFIFPSLWRTRFHRFHLPISIFPIVHDTIRNFFRATNRVSLPPIFDRSLFNLHHELKDKFVISAVKFTRLHGYTVHDEFLFPFINRMSLCAVVGSIRVSFVPNRKMSITVPTWTESPLSPSFVPPVLESKLFDRFCRRRPTRFPRDRVPGEISQPGSPVQVPRMYIWRGNNSRRRYRAPLHLQFPLHQYC